MRALWLLVLAVLMVGSVGGRAPRAAAHESRRLPASDPGISTSPRLSVIKPAPDFALPDTTGRLVRLTDLRGRVVLLSFIYARCSDACPLLTQRIALLRDRLQRAGLRRWTHFLSVTVDPERDSAEVLARYATRFGGATGQWQFLRDAPSRVRPVLAAYDEWARPRAGGDVDHPARLYLIDPLGNIREIYSLAFFDERQAFVDIRALLAESREPPRPGQTPGEKGR